MKLVKVTLNISKELANFIEKMSKEKCVNKTTIINQALANERFIQNTQELGGKIFIESKDKQIVPVIFM